MVFKALYFAHRRPDHWCMIVSQWYHIVRCQIGANSCTCIQYCSTRSAPCVHQINKVPLHIDLINWTNSERAVCSSKQAKWRSDVGLAYLKLLHTCKASSHNGYFPIILRFGLSLSSTTGKDLHALYSLSHMPTLITISIVFWGISSFFHEKCDPDGTRTHNLCILIATHRATPFQHKGWRPTWKIGWVLIWCNWITGRLWYHIPNTCSLLQGCGFKSSCSKIFWE